MEKGEVKNERERGSTSAQDLAPKVAIREVPGPDFHKQVSFHQVGYSK